MKTSPSQMSLSGYGNNKMSFGFGFLRTSSRPQDSSTRRSISFKAYKNVFVLNDICRCWQLNDWGSFK